uniref:Putative ovule protein n=1 Tax=Solanum chacoense TaxID=4108 RepID=A0A0V0H185_SOLCH
MIIRKSMQNLMKNSKSHPCLNSYSKNPSKTKKRTKGQLKTSIVYAELNGGVGDCSTAGMTPEDRDSFIAMLKQKAGVE